jgi:hypothetical protein
VALFVVSFLVLFLETALIRWMPAYIRLLAYFSNFILLAAFLGIGVGCLLAGRAAAPNRARNLFGLFPAVLFALVFAVDYLRLEVAVPSTSTIYFSSGTTSPVVPVESTRLLPIIFVAVAALFVTVATRLGRELAAHRPLRAYTINLAGSLAGVGAFALVSWLQLPPAAWFGVAAIAATPLLFERSARLQTSVDPSPKGSRSVFVVNLALLAATVLVAFRMQGGSLWSPYYRINLTQDGPDTVVEVNHIFHQSMAPVVQKEYFYQWPYTVFGDTFEDVLILGAGTGTDVSAALRHGARHVDAVEIDPVILRVGAERHPDHPYSDPRVAVICDDARHFLRTTTKRYDLVVFALIDSLTVQSSFSGVRLESYMFTQESFDAVRDHLKPNGVMALYNYFREKWLVDRLANSLTATFGGRGTGAPGLSGEPTAQVHQDRAYLAVMLAGPRAITLKTPPPLPDLVLAYGQSHAPSPARPLVRDTSVAPATDDWPFLYLRAPGLPSHYAVALSAVLAISIAAVWLSLGSDRGRWSWPFFFYGAGFMLLETKSIVQFALLWGSTWTSASLAIASVLAMALASTLVAARIDIRRRAPIAIALFALLLLNWIVPVGSVAFASRADESLFYGALVFSPVFCAGLLFSASFRQSTSASTDFGANLLGAMVGGVGEYLSLLAGYRSLIILVAVCYLSAVVIPARD